MTLWMAAQPRRCVVSSPAFLVAHTNVGMLCKTCCDSHTPHNDAKFALHADVGGYVARMSGNDVGIVDVESSAIGCSTVLSQGKPMLLLLDCKLLLAAVSVVSFGLSAEVYVNYAISVTISVHIIKACIQTGGKSNTNAFCISCAPYYV